jgi:hypothetical protein
VERAVWGFDGLHKAAPYGAVFVYYPFFASPFAFLGKYCIVSQEVLRPLQARNDPEEIKKKERKEVGMLNFTVSTSRRLRQKMKSELGDGFLKDHNVAYLFCARFALFADMLESWHDGIFVLDPGLSRVEMTVSVARANENSNQLVFYVDTPAKPKNPDEAESVLVTAQFSLVSRRGRETVAKYYFRVQGGVVTMFELPRRKPTVSTTKPLRTRPRRTAKRARVQ